MDNKNRSTSGGLGLGTILFLIFLVLKLCNVITWSWWWVTAPLWISAILWVLILGGIFIYYASEDYRSECRLRNWRKKNGKD